MNRQLITPVRHGLLMGIAALIFGALWAAYMAHTMNNYTVLLSCNNRK